MELDPQVMEIVKWAAAGIVGGVASVVAYFAKRNDKARDAEKESEKKRREEESARILHLERTTESAISTLKNTIEVNQNAVMNRFDSLVGSLQAISTRQDGFDGSLRRMHERQDTVGAEVSRLKTITELHGLDRAAGGKA